MVKSMFVHIRFGSHLIIYNVSTCSYKILNTSESVIDFQMVSGIECVKALILPLDICPNKASFRKVFNV